LLLFDCSPTKLCPGGTTPSSPNCRVVLARPLRTESTPTVAASGTSCPAQETTCFVFGGWILLQQLILSEQELGFQDWRHCCHILCDVEAGGPSYSTSTNRPRRLVEW
jgi:hypothetical protein